MEKNTVFGVTFSFKKLLSEQHNITKKVEHASHKFFAVFLHVIGLDGNALQ